MDLSTMATEEKLSTTMVTDDAPQCCNVFVFDDALMTSEMYRCYCEASAVVLKPTLSNSRIDLASALTNYTAEIDLSKATLVLDVPTQPIDIQVPETARGIDQFGLLIGSDDTSETKKQPCIDIKTCRPLALARKWLPEVDKMLGVDGECRVFDPVAMQVLAERDDLRANQTWWRCSLFGYHIDAGTEWIVIPLYHCEDLASLEANVQPQLANAVEFFCAASAAKASQCWRISFSRVNQASAQLPRLQIYSTLASALHNQQASRPFVVTSRMDDDEICFQLTFAM